MVHRIEPGHHVSGKGGRLREIETATGKLINDFGDVSKTRHSGARQRGNSSKEAPLPDFGWIENSGWANTGDDPIVYFTTSWVVPPAPASNDGQVVFLFNGLEQGGAGATPLGPYILQPVLQWGVSYAGGGNYWSITNWYVDGQGGLALYTPPLIQVNPGDVLQGVVTLTGKSGDEYSYLSSFIGYPKVNLTVNEIDELTWACETLECYGSDDTTLSRCTDYPNTILTAMGEIEIKIGQSAATGKDATLDWSAATNYTDCGQKCVIVSNNSPGGLVYLYYRPMPFIPNNVRYPPETWVDTGDPLQQEIISVLVLCITAGGVSAQLQADVLEIASQQLKIAASTLEKRIKGLQGM
jgi:hypothetical protein